LKEKSSVREEEKKIRDNNRGRRHYMDKIHSLDNDETRKTLEEQGRKGGLENASLARRSAVRV
jgi:hypothetical protein